MNPDQLKSFGTSLLVIVSTVLTVLVATGKITSEQSSNFTNSLQALIPAIITVIICVYKIFPHADAAKVTAASNVPGVQVSVDTKAASVPVAAVAADPKTNVNPL
jgi:hypothetical protein